ncbi:hypothetical protein PAPPERLAPAPP_05740 [Brevundimonas phage vB_BpoS-Papperlapapp]|uniref:Uncharacterized protein n=2 Tax=Marchewkavirus TaxID=3425052 RepID=A0A9E7SK82_9CAUD|nr:hypothetical protein KABACHOK_04110 [Brevundimonas phage vB_BpoS-Kabachok]USN14939.1 hypothetical protein DOMOVOI_04680 [Brevundimonas phage vB_BpoS-Domovoi]USN16312.1 hypothetical protein PAPPERLAPAPP_05740 [Brevundimonas phage vB_BpoS-Papperlapapp]
MNAALAPTFPPVAAFVQAVESPSADIEARHMDMIRGAAAMNDMLLEDLTPESMAILGELVEHFRSNLLHCQAASAIRLEATSG